MPTELFLLLLLTWTCQTSFGVQETAVETAACCALGFVPSVVASQVNKTKQFPNSTFFTLLLRFLVQGMRRQPQRSDFVSQIDTKGQRLCIVAKHSKWCTHLSGSRYIVFCLANCQWFIQLHLLLAWGSWMAELCVNSVQLANTSLTVPQ